MFRNFQKDGVWDAIWQQLHMDLREDIEREARPTAAEAVLVVIVAACDEQIAAFVITVAPDPA